MIFFTFITHISGQSVTSSSLSADDNSSIESSDSCSFDILDHLSPLQNIKSLEPQTLLHEASLVSNLPVILYSLSLGASPNMSLDIESSGKGPLIKAVESVRIYPVLQLS